MKIELIGVSDVEGGKGIFDKTATAVGIAVAELKDVSASVASFCEEFSEGLKGISSQSGGLSLKSIELNIELTLKGEVRLIASASTETKGSVKLIFGTNSRE